MSTSHLRHAFFSNSTKFFEELGLFTSSQQKWKQSLSLCWLFLFCLRPFYNEKIEEPTEGVSNALRTKYKASSQIKEPFESDKHAALHHLFLMLNPAVCPDLVCRALTR